MYKPQNMHLFYSPEIIDESVFLNKEESQHCVRVLRLKENEMIHLTDGKGKLFLGQILFANPDKCLVRIIEQITNIHRRNYKINIAIAPTQQIDRFEWFIEKTTEIGIDSIIPILCEHSERKIVKPERLQKLIISASKQSLNCIFPTLTEIQPFDKIIKQKFDGEKFIAHCSKNKKSNLQQIYSHGKDVLILIGPEGDFSQSEIQAAQEHGFKEISLGETRLRTETAGIVACHTIHLLNSPQN